MAEQRPQKLVLACVMFVDELHNVVLAVPEMRRPVGAYDRDERWPESLTMALTHLELKPALEAVLRMFETTPYSPDGISLIERVRVVLESGPFTKEDRATGAA